MASVDTAQTVGRTLVLLGIITVVLIAAFSTFAGTITDQASPEDRRAGPNVTTGEFVQFQGTGIRDGDIEQVYRVNDSTGYAVQLDGSDDSYVQSDADLSIATGDNWTVGTWARVADGAAGENMTALSADGRVIIQYNGSQANWSAWYYDDGSTDSWRVNVSAPNQAGNLSLVTVQHNGTHLTIYRNTTQGDVVNTTAGPNTEPIRLNSTNWNGTLDETRTFDDPLNDSQRAALVNDPVGPLPNATRTARIMYDEGSGSNTAIYFASTGASLSGHQWVNGHRGAILTEGTDYEIDVSGGEIKALAGGEIDGAPVAWVFYRFDPWDGPFAALFTATENLGASAITLATIAVLVLAGAKVVNSLDSF